MSRSAAVVVVVAVVAACKPSDAPPPPPPPTTTAPAAPRAPVPPIKRPGPPLTIGKPCEAEGSELVYVLADDDELFSFDPQKLPGDPFHLIARLDCGLVQPNSMAVDRFGIAWIVDHHAHVFRASILDGRCEAAGKPAGDPPSTFGMGFVAKPGGGETLFVASDETDGKQASQLGTLDTTTTPPTYASLAPLAARGKWNPEFSGTGDGKLFGYFPLAGGNGFVQEIDIAKAPGAARGKRWNVPSDTEVGAWAFAQWGGKFYVFMKLAGNNVIHEIRRKTGDAKVVHEHGAFAIIGAGVSTCAPVLEKP